MFTGSEPSCPTCNRAFHDKSEAEELKEDLQTEIDQIPKKVASLKTNLERAEKIASRLQEMKLPKKQLDADKVGAVFLINCGIAIFK